MTGGSVLKWPTKAGRNLMSRIMKELEPGFGEYRPETPNAKYSSIGNTFISVSGGDVYNPVSMEHIVEFIKDLLHRPFGYCATGDVIVTRMPSFIMVQALTRGLIFKIQFRKESPYYFDWTEVLTVLGEKYPGAGYDK